MGVFDSWLPVTCDFGLIQATPGQFSSAYREWRFDLEKKPRRTQVHASLSAAFAALPPLSMGLYRKLFVGTRNGWTAFFQSGILGSDPSPVMSQFARRLNTLAMRVCARPGDPKSPGAIWEVYAPSEMGGTPPRFARRSIACSDDGHWVFEQFGEPYPFEDLERYRAKRNRDRFDAALLQCYLREFGLDAFSDDFYRVDASSPAILIEDGVRYDFKEFTLAEVVAGRPWVR